MGFRREPQIDSVEATRPLGKRLPGRALPQRPPVQLLAFTRASRLAPAPSASDLPCRRGFPPLRWAQAVLHVQLLRTETARSRINVLFLCVSGQIFLRERGLGLKRSCPVAALHSSAATNATVRLLLRQLR